jgi:hypothetical protein
MIVALSVHSSFGAARMESEQQHSIRDASSFVDGVF